MTIIEIFELEQHVKCFGPDLAIEREQSHAMARVRRDRWKSGFGTSIDGHLIAVDLVTNLKW